MKKPVRVLVFEDSPGDLELIKAHLAGAVSVKFSVDHAPRLASGLEKLQRSTIDVVLLDLQLPDSAGVATLAAVHSAFPRLPIVVLTGTKDPRLEVEVAGRGAQDLLHKDKLDPELLERSLLYAITRRRMAHSDHQLRGAQDIQRRLLPERSPDLAGFDIAAVCRPAEMACGDCFDYVPMQDGSQGIVVADVSGHGFGAALLMAEVRAYLRAFTLLWNDAGEVLTRLNQIVFQDVDEGYFITVGFARIDPQTREIDFAGAGHDAYILRGDGSVTSLPSTGFPLGLMPEARVRRTSPAPLEPGDMLLMFTDGLVEAMTPDGEMFGIERTLGIAAGNRTIPAADIVDLLAQTSSDFAGRRQQQDDITIVVAKCVAR
jgi:serine phosphatase RsbU (regulator of sigma subunit)